MKKYIVHQIYVHSTLFLKFRFVYAEGVRYSCLYSQCANIAETLLLFRHQTTHLYLKYTTIKLVVNFRRRVYLLQRKIWRTSYLYFLEEQHK